MECCKELLTRTEPIRSFSHVQSSYPVHRTEPSSQGWSLYKINAYLLDPDIVLWRLTSGGIESEGRKLDRFLRCFEMTWLHMEVGILHYKEVPTYLINVNTAVANAADSGPCHHEPVARAPPSIIDIPRLVVILPRYSSSCTALLNAELFLDDELASRSICLLTCLSSMCVAYSTTPPAPIPDSGR